MTISSQQPDFSITLDDLDNSTSSVTSLGDTITLTSNISSVSIPTSWNYSYAGSSASTITISNFNQEYQTNWGQTEFVDSWPEWHRIEKMCKEYPGLKIALEKFKTTYYLVKDDYDTPKTKK